MIDSFETVGIQTDDADRGPDTKVEQRESIREDLAEFLSERNPETISIPDVNGELLTIYKFTHSQELPVKIPQGYALMGGEARNLVLRELGEPVRPARDTDIVAIEEFNPDLSLVEDLSQEHMHDDWQYGHGISTDNLSDYFATRDFRMNQVLVHGNEMYVSEQALLDLNDKVIQPTVYRSDDGWGVDPKLAMKSLRLQIEFQQMYGHGEIRGIEEWQWEFDEVPLFWLAYGLNRAYQSGDDVARLFYTKLLEKGTLHDDDPHSNNIDRKLHEAALDIRFMMEEDGDYPFEFDNPEWNEEFINNLLQEDKYDQLAEDYAIMIKGIRGRDKGRYSRASIG